MVYAVDMECCACVELSCIQDSSYNRSKRGPAIILYDLFLRDRDIEFGEFVGSKFYENTDFVFPAFYIFTQAVSPRSQRKRDGIGYCLEAFIRENGLGSVEISGPARNPNTGNYVTVFVWQVNADGMRRYLRSVVREELKAGK